MRYLRLTFRVTSECEDALVAELWQLGTLGVEVRPPRAEGRDGEFLEAYFEARDGLSGTAETLAAGITDAELVAVSEVEERDWLAEYRAAAEPFAIGPFVVDPREPAAGVEPDGGRSS